MGLKTVTPSRFPHNTPPYRPQGEIQKIVDNFAFIAAGLDQNLTPTTAINTAGAGTYAAADLLGGMIVRDPSGASRSDTLSTAALLVAALTKPQVGDIIVCRVLNNADAAETITLLAGSGGSFGAANKTHTIAQNGSVTLRIRLTGVDAGSEAYVIYD